MKKGYCRHTSWVFQTYFTGKIHMNFQHLKCVNQMRILHVFHVFYLQLISHLPLFERMRTMYSYCEQGCIGVKPTRGCLLLFNMLRIFSFPCFPIFFLAYKNKTLAVTCILHVKYVGSMFETHKICVKYTDFSCVKFMHISEVKLRFQSDGHATRSPTKQQRRIAKLCLCL